MSVERVVMPTKETIPVQQKPTKIRWIIVAMLFFVTTINYADRATISIAASPLQSDLGINSITMGCVFCFWLGLCHWTNSRWLAFG
jgi:ACS family glucarate transporter-like MFS transporter